MRLTSALPSRLPIKYIFDVYSYSLLIRKQLKVQFERLQTVLIVKKPGDPQTISAQSSIVDFILRSYPDINIVIEDEDITKPLDVEKLYQIPTGIGPLIGNTKEYSRIVDLVITLGGDGTVLHVSSLFPQEVPPILSFSLGSLGFLLPHSFLNYKTVLTNIFNGSIPILKRMRLQCSIYSSNSKTPSLENIQIMNEVAVHRAQNAQLASIDCFVGGEYLTDAVADGLVVATPTGSTAYSLSAGGPIVHPNVQSIILTPICPRSLSFRPIILPYNQVITMMLSSKSRGSAHITIDGKDYFELKKGDKLEVKLSPFPIPSVSNRRTDWQKGITNTLRWNQSFANSRGNL